jgi:hypothetical protein
MTPQQHADYLLTVWQQRRHLKPIYRLTDFSPPAPVSAVNEREREVPSVLVAA